MILATVTARLSRILFATLWVLGGLAAQSDDELLKTAFGRLDANKDGTLPRREFPGSDRQFAAMDKDADVKVTFDEYRGSEVGRALLRAHYRSKMDAHPRTTVEQLLPARFEWLARADPDKDGKVTRAEWRGAEASFLQLDVDGNGILDKRDRAEAQAQAPPAEPAAPMPKGDLLPTEDLLRRHDKDKDGRLAGKELDKYLQQALPFFDRNDDQALDAAELDRIYVFVNAARMQAESDRARPVPYEVPFDAWDKDKDDMVRQNEWQGPRALFDQMDLDRDAAVSRDEVLRYRKRTSGADFIERYDLDGDGKVSPAEFAGPIGAFHRADRSGDGKITRADK